MRFPTLSHLGNYSPNFEQMGPRWSRCGAKVLVPGSRTSGPRRIHTKTPLRELVQSCIDFDQAACLP